MNPGSAALFPARHRYGSAAGSPWDASSRPALLRNSHSTVPRHCPPSMHKSGEDSRLARVTKIALAFPEATRLIHGSHAQFLVRKKTFAYFLDDHHGDGIVGITCKLLHGENKALAEAQPDRF